MRSRNLWAQFAPPKSSQSSHRRQKKRQKKHPKRFWCELPTENWPIFPTTHPTDQSNVSLLWDREVGGRVSRWVGEWVDRPKAVDLVGHTHVRTLNCTCLSHYFRHALDPCVSIHYCCRGWHICMSLCVSQSNSPPGRRQQYLLPMHASSAKQVYSSRGHFTSSTHSPDFTCHCQSLCLRLALFFCVGGAINGGALILKDGHITFSIYWGFLIDQNQ